MKLSIIVPVYNEEDTIGHVLEKLIKVKLPWEKEIIVIDDGSSDTTASEVQSSKLKAQNEKIKIIKHQKNLGKGAAVRSGVKAATGDYILIQDADLEYDPEEIPKLLDPLNSQNSLNASMAVYGSRFMNNTARISSIYYVGNKLLTQLTNWLYGTRLTDMETGYKLLPAAFTKQLKLKASHFDMEPEITVKLIRQHIFITEVPISYQGRTHGMGKKITVRDAIEAVKTLFVLKNT